MSTKEEIEKRRAERAAAHDKARAAQELKDLEAIDAYEAASGEPLYTMTANGFKAGAAVKIAFRAPSPVEYKRFCDMVGKAMAKDDPLARRKAQEMLAETCIVYPLEGDERKKTLEAHPGVLISLAIECAKVVELRNEEEGK